MEPVTHILTGVCLARSGANRTAAYATVTMAIAAELPDIDTVWSLRGPVDAFQHHRGITHTFVGVPLEAALLVGAVWGWHKAGFRVRGPGSRKPLHKAGFRGQGPGSRRQRLSEPWALSSGPSIKVPVRWGVLYGWAVVGLLSHLLLDFTNNYGLRPFFPFDGRWYAASIVFIVDPLMLVLLVGALVMPLLFGLVGAEVGARRSRFRGRGWAVAALVGIVGWWTLRAVEHGRAVEMAQGQSVVAPGASTFELPTSQNRDMGHTASSAGQQIPSGKDIQQSKSNGGEPAAVVPDEPAAVVPDEPAAVYLTPQRVWMSPHPFSPFLWSGVLDVGPGYQLAEVDVRRDTVTAAEVLLPKPAGETVVRAAMASRLGRAYLDWSPMPLVTAQAGEGGETEVTFRDPRFMGAPLAERGRTALVGTVVLDARGHVVEQTMDGRVQKGRD